MTTNFIVTPLDICRTPASWEVEGVIWLSDCGEEDEYFFEFTIDSDGCFDYSDDYAAPEEYVLDVESYLENLALNRRGDLEAVFAG